MDAGFEQTMLALGAQGKFVAFAALGRWTTSSRCDWGDAARVLPRSRSADRASADSATAGRPVVIELVLRRSGPHVRATRHRVRVAPITAIVIVAGA